MTMISKERTCPSDDLNLSQSASPEMLEKAQQPFSVPELNNHSDLQLRTSQHQNMRFCLTVHEPIIPCTFCEYSQYPQSVMLNGSLFEKYTSTGMRQFYAKDVDDILEEAVVPVTVKFFENLVTDEHDEFLRRYYGLHEWHTKITALSEYYKFHQNIPKFYGMPIELLLERYTHRRRNWEYKKIRKILRQQDGQTDAQPSQDSASFHQSYVKKSKYSFVLQELKNSTDLNHKEKQGQKPSTAPIESKRGSAKQQYANPPRNSIRSKPSRQLQSGANPALSQSAALLDVFEKLNNVLKDTDVNPIPNLNMPIRLHNYGPQNFEKWIRNMSTQKREPRTQASSSKVLTPFSAGETAPSTPAKPLLLQKVPSFLKKKTSFDPQTERLPPATTSKKTKLTNQERQSLEKRLGFENPISRTSSKAFPKQSVVTENILNSNPRYAHLIPDVTDPKHRILFEDKRSRNSLVANYSGQQAHPLTMLTLNSNMRNNTSRNIVKAVDFASGVVKLGQIKKNGERTIEKIYGAQYETPATPLKSEPKNSMSLGLIRRSLSNTKVPAMQTNPKQRVSSLPRAQKKQKGPMLSTRQRIGSMGRLEPRSKAEQKYRETRQMQKWSDAKIFASEQKCVSMKLIKEQPMVIIKP